MYHLTCACCTLVPEIRVRPGTPWNAPCTPWDSPCIPVYWRAHVHDLQLHSTERCHIILGPPLRLGPRPHLPGKMGLLAPSSLYNGVARRHPPGKMGPPGTILPVQWGHLAPTSRYNGALSALFYWEDRAPSVRIAPLLSSRKRSSWLVLAAAI